MDARRQNCSLPSHNYAADFLEARNLRTTKGLVISYLGRAAILYAGFFVARRGVKESLSLSLIGSAAIETYVLFEVSKMLREGRCR